MSSLNSYVVIRESDFGERIFNLVSNLKSFNIDGTKNFTVLSDNDLRFVKGTKRGYAVGVETSASGGERYYTDCIIQLLSEKYCQRIYFLENEKAFFQMKYKLDTRNLRDTLRREYKQTLSIRHNNNIPPNSWLAFKVSVDCSEDQRIIDKSIDFIQAQLQQFEADLVDLEKEMGVTPDMFEPNYTFEKGKKKP